LISILRVPQGRIGIELAYRPAVKAGLPHIFTENMNLPGFLRQGQEQGEKGYEYI
jgi:hypothetical protein